MNLEPMWEKLAGYQIYAERRGFGEAWKRMTTERTKEAADAADQAMFPNHDAAVAKWALWAALEAVESAPVAAWKAEKWANRAVERINEAFEEEIARDASPRP